MSVITSHIRAKIAVDFAFLTFSSSPYAVVYRIHDQTMAHTAKRAANRSAFLATFITRSLTPVTQSRLSFGSTHTVPIEHPWIKSRDGDSADGHSAYPCAKKVKEAKVKNMRMKDLRNNILEFYSRENRDHRI